jgi:hypothetical protein
MGAARQSKQAPVKRTSYAGQRLRFLELPGGGLLLNTSDVCAIAGITQRKAGSLLAQSCLSLDDVLLATTRHHIDFVQWLLVKFADYEMGAERRPKCDDDWKSFKWDPE